MLIRLKNSLFIVCLLTMALAFVLPVHAEEAADEEPAAEPAAGFPPLPITGLTLPEGSTFRGQLEKREELQQLVGADRTIDELLVVAFDNEADWQTVRGHIGELLLAAGFVDEYAEREGEQEYLTENGPLLMDMSALMRSWNHPETGQWVALNNMNARFDRENPERAKLPDGRTVLRWPVAVNELEPHESEYELQIISFKEQPAD